MRVVCRDLVDVIGANDITVIGVTLARLSTIGFQGESTGADNPDRLEESHFAEDAPQGSAGLVFRLRRARASAASPTPIAMHALPAGIPTPSSAQYPPPACPPSFT